MPAFDSAVRKVASDPGFPPGGSACAVAAVLIKRTRTASTTSVCIATSYKLAPAVNILGVNARCTLGCAGGEGRVPHEHRRRVRHDVGRPPRRSGAAVQ